jgi:hypothetical protein
MIHSLDLIYKPIGAIKNLYSQLSGKAYVWKTGAMSEIETQGATLGMTYKVLRASAIVGVILCIICATPLFPLYIKVFLSPYIISFLMGPLAIWLTAKPMKR